MDLITIATNESHQRKLDSMLPYSLRVWKNLAPPRQRVQKEQKRSKPDHRRE